MRVTSAKIEANGMMIKTMSPIPLAPNHMAAFAIIEAAIYVISTMDSTWFIANAPLIGSCNIGLFKTICSALGKKEAFDDVIYPIVVPLFMLIALTLPKVVGGYTRYAMVIEVILTGMSSVCSLALMIAVLVLDQVTDASQLINHSNYGPITYAVMILGIINASLFITGLTEGLVSKYDKTAKKADVTPSANRDEDMVSLNGEV